METTTPPAPVAAPASRKPLRFVTASALFDGHDASINIIRRMLQASGVEVIHLGHNRSAAEVVDTAVQEDADALAVSSYQGGHTEYFGYVLQLLGEAGAGHIRVFGGGGGVIVPDEIRALEAAGVARIYSPDDGLALGLDGMIADMIARCAPPAAAARRPAASQRGAWLRLARALTAVEEGAAPAAEGRAPIVGVTGSGGAGKSTLVDELLRRLVAGYPALRVAVLSVDPTRRKTGGALLGDRIRMNTLYGEHADRLYMRSFATRGAHRSVSPALAASARVCAAFGYDLVFVETAGIGQGDTEIADLADLSLYVMTPEYGAPTQLEKIGMLDEADLVVVNKAEKRGAEDALRDVRKQVRRCRPEAAAESVVFATRASHVGDPGMDRLYEALAGLLAARCGLAPEAARVEAAGAREQAFAPLRAHYLEEVVGAVRAYRRRVEANAALAGRWSQARGVLEQLKSAGAHEPEAVAAVAALEAQWRERMDPDARRILETWEERRAQYAAAEMRYEVRGREVVAAAARPTLSGTRLPRVAFPRIEGAADRVRFGMLENTPGAFPFTAGVFPFKRDAEDPTRMFAGEGAPERTNRRFHLVSRGMPAKRLSTAFDSVTLYGHDPSERPDIYGKVGNSGVSVCTLDDMKKLYSGFDLCDARTSVSMTINGPAPMLLAMFMNTAIDQQVERWLRQNGSWQAAEAALGARPGYTPFSAAGLAEGLPEGHDGSGLGLLGASGQELVRRGLLEADVYARLRAETLASVRGTVQADILKEDQAQNTCIFSTEFSLGLMGDVQEYFVREGVRNFYSVSISGYHIAEAGANPITQLALTLANGFTYVEYFRARGMAVDAFAPNLSFFFSNGMDAEYGVLGRVARRIWAVAMRDLYKADERSQKLKYHIQTSGRSLHAREVEFNDIRTTLQALLATYDHCNSLHTNAFDEAITTPTEASVRRALAIQLIINNEFGPAACENPMQGAYLTEALTDLVEEAVLKLLGEINERGGVLGAMETRFQRGRIQDESMQYEQKKHAGELPLVGVNMFTAEPAQAEAPGGALLMRSSEEEKRRQIEGLRAFQARHAEAAPAALAALRAAARAGGNVFDALMTAVTCCSLGQITGALFEVGGRHRRNM